MKNILIIAVLWILFAVSHMVLSSQAVRPRLIARLGQLRFTIVYSVVAVVIFAPLVFFAFTNLHTGPLLWAPPQLIATRLVFELINILGFIIIIAGMMTPSPVAVLGPARDKPTGVLRITRHPMFMGIGIWGFAHLVSNGYASDVVFFGGFVVFAVVGCWHQDRRKLAEGSASFQRFYELTALIPFTKRGALRGIRELSPWAVIGGVVVALVIRYLHPSIAGW